MIAKNFEIEAESLASTIRTSLWRVVAAFLALSLLGIVIYLNGKLDFSLLARPFFQLSTMAWMTAMGFGFTQILLQSARLWVLLPGVNTIRFWGVLRIFTRGQILNQIFPARVGDIAKVSWLRRAQAGPGEAPLPMSELLGSVMVADKLTDLLALAVWAIVLAPGWVVQIDSTRTLSAIFSLEIEEIALGVGGVCIVAALLQRTYGKKVQDFIQGVFRGAHGLFTPKRFALALSCSLGAWMSEAWLLAKLSGSLGHPLGIAEAFVALAILNMGIAVPVTFANLGTFEGALAFGLSQFDIPLTDGFAIAVAAHAVQILVVAILGLALPKRFWIGLRPLKNRNCVIPHSGVQPQDKARALFYYESKSANYSQSVRKGPLCWLRRREERAILQFLGLGRSSGMSLLDAGCGDGKYSLLAKSAGMTVLAIDASAGMVRQLEGKVDCFLVGDLEVTPIPGNHDRVLCAGVLDFVLEPKTTFEKLCQAVKPGGRLVILVPRKGVWGQFYRFEKRLQGFCVNLFSSHELESWARPHGLELLGILHPLPTNMVIAFERP